MLCFVEPGARIAFLWPVSVDGFFCLAHCHCDVGSAGKHGQLVGFNKRFLGNGKDSVGARWR
jgi:hypothetical protein